MSTDKIFAKRTLYKAWLYISGRGLQYNFFDEYQRGESLSADQVEKQVELKVKLLLNHAYNHVSYYRTRLKELGCSSESIQAEPVQTLTNLSTLRKEDIRSEFDRLKSMDLTDRNWYYNTSGGSTGEPVRFIQDQYYHQSGIAQKWLFNLWTGYEVGMPRIKLWGSERDVLGGEESLKTRFGRWLRNEHWLNAFKMTEADMFAFVERINAVQPTQILAYAESAFEFAQFIQEERLTIHSPEAVMTSAGTLQAHMRELIEDVFEAPVFNRYGSREVGDVACECETHGGLHVNPLTHYVEIVRDDGSHCEPGEVGEVLVTLLTNLSMPMIRYRIGDRAAWAEMPCECGRQWPLLKNIYGRVNSIIKTSSGAFDSAALTSLLYFKDVKKHEPFSSFSKYQIVQKSKDYIILKVLVAEPSLWESEKRVVMRKLRRTFGGKVRIDVVSVDQIAPSPSGKYHYVWSEVE